MADDVANTKRGVGDDGDYTPQSGFAPFAHRCAWPRWEVVVNWGEGWDPEREVYWQSMTWIGAQFALWRLCRAAGMSVRDMRSETWPLVVERVK